MEALDTWLRLVEIDGDLMVIHGEIDVNRCVGCIL
jgi:hypothetical protein